MTSPPVWLMSSLVQLFTLDDSKARSACYLRRSLKAFHKLDHQNIKFLIEEQINFSFSSRCYHSQWPATILLLIKIEIY